MRSKGKLEQRLKEEAMNTNHAATSQSLPYAWLCRICEAHSDDMPTELLAEEGATTHAAERHPGEQRHVS